MAKKKKTNRKGKKRARITRSVTRKGQRKQKHLIVKRRGHIQEYDPRKIYASCFYACKNAHLHDAECKRIAAKVEKEITKFVKSASKKKTVTSTEIFLKVAKALKKYNSDAAFLFATHRDIS